jgi:murein DD-endopeptidase MepM/ murein hydrolase activator NlpD
MRLFPLRVLCVAAGLLALSACDETAPGSGSSSSSSASETATSSGSASSGASESSSSSSLIDFPHGAPTALKAGSGQGYTDTSNWAPGICFPIADTPVYANSQVYMAGGSAVPSNTAQCDPGNYAYPWVDNFCESRSWTNPMCKSGQGHQGQDIRPKTCKANQYWAVAAEDGVVTQLGSYTVAITGNGEPHRIYRYLHMQTASLKVKLHDPVTRGQKLGLISNNLGTSGGKPAYTTIHLHFEVRIAEEEDLGNGNTLAANSFVPPYAALVDAYQRKLGGDCPTAP